MTDLHINSSESRWRSMSLSEQLANIGAEVGRAAKWQGKDEEKFSGAVTRASELLDLTLEDQRWRGRLFEIGRVKELFYDGVSGRNEYRTDLKDLENYFYPFMGLAAKNFKF